MNALFQKDDKAGGCPYDCDVKADVMEIKDDVKKLVADLNQRIGAARIKKTLSQPGGKVLFVKGAFAGIAACGALVAVVVGIIGVLP